MTLLAATMTRNPRASRQVQSAWRALGASLVLVVAMSAAAEAQLPTPPDTAAIVNRASLTFTAPDGSIGSDTASARVLLKLLAGATLTPPRAQAAPPASRRVLAHVLHNTGTAADAFALSATAPAGWTVAIYMDVNGDGALDAGDLPVGPGVSLARDATAQLLAVIDVPAGAAGGFVGAIDLRATSQMDKTVSATVQDRITIVAGTSASGIAFDKAVDRASAQAGDTLSWSLAYLNAGTAATAPALLSDVLPKGAHFVAGSLRWNGLPLTDAPDADAGQFNRTALGLETVQLSVGAIAVNGSGVVSFRAVVGTDALAGAMANVATLDAGGTPVSSTTATTTIAVANLQVTKQLTSADSATAGDLVTYRIDYSNSSATVIATNVVLVDTLPSELQYVSAAGAPVVNGQVVTWTIGSLAQQSGSVQLIARALRPTAAGGLVNGVVIAASNSAASSASARALRIVGYAGSELLLTKSAGVLDVALGEPVPYTLVVRNVSTVPLDKVIVRDLLPAGMSFVPASLAGADSAHVTGQLLDIHVSGTLVAGGQATVRYGAVLSSAGASRTLINRAVAEAAGGLVRSDTASAPVRVRAGYAMQGRTLLGKVYVDANDNGVQDTGEVGVASAQIITADGQIVVTDKEGRFSLRDVAPGTHALRLDTLTAMPRGFGLARAADEMAVVRTDGWTTPRVEFRLVPRAGAAIPCPDSASLVAAAMPVRLAAAASAPRGAALRSDEDRAADERGSFINGPSVFITSPVDGAIVASNKVFVGVKGEAGAAVTLYEGGRVIAESALRPDGVQDFIGVELTPGPHHLRAKIVNSWKQERWDSVSVHRSGLPATIEVLEETDKAPIILRVDETVPVRVRARVLDQWQVAVASTPDVTVSAVGATLLGNDSDASSAGQQRRADANGIVTVLLRGGNVVGEGRLLLSVTQKIQTRRTLRVLPTLRALTVTGAAQMGVGAATENFGAVTARGAVGHETSVTMSYDSRRGGENDFFGRGYDPLAEARYATYGDGSESRSLAGATQRFSARLERGLDWVELGDVVARPAADKDALLAGYQRSLAGVSARVATGALTWNGFGSLTRQALETQQLRGDGGSGPYVFGAGARPGTDRITLEVRARENAARVIARETLVRFSDYEIDYETGAVLLRRPVPAEDPYGNPVYLVAVLERMNSGAEHFVGGGRVEADVARFLVADALRVVDSLKVGFTGVRDGGATGIAGAAATSTATLAATDIVGADLRMTAGQLTLGGELLRIRSADSTGGAARASLRWALPGDRASLGASWLRVDPGMTGTLDPRLGAGLSELHLDAGLLVGDTRLRLAHDRQHFAQYGIDRQNTSATVKGTVNGRAVTQEIGLISDRQDAAGTAASSALSGKTTVSVASKVDVWLEATHALKPAADSLAPLTSATQQRPDQMGVGVAYRFAQGFRLEATHRMATTRDTTGGQPSGYSVTSLNLRAQTMFGGEAWGGVERAGETRASHAAVLGWNQHLAVGGGWAVSTLYERRVGLSAAPLADPVRALPFARPEGDRWSVGAGLDWMPTSDHSRLALHGEARNGDGRRGQRITFSGDAPLGAGAALITLHDWSQYNVTTPGLTQLSRQDRSVLGLALRPVASNKVDVLAKLEWRRTLNPLSGATGASSVLGSTGADKRLLGAADAIWAATTRTEIAARYAVRWSANDQLLDSTGAALGIRAQYLGARLEQGMTRDGVVRLRLDARMLLEQASSAAPWSVAPSAVLRVGPRLELEAGYRMGALRDPDFAANGGSGAFATIGVRFTESLITGPASFWRDRIAGDR
jgi:uncharacterized repeat protein (TIGR01451 family)